MSGTLRSIPAYPGNSPANRGQTYHSVLTCLKSRDPVTSSAAAAAAAAAAAGHMATAHTAGYTADRPKSARRAGQPSYRGIAPRRCTPAASPPAARGVVKVSERGRRWKEHNEAVRGQDARWSTFLGHGRWKPAKCDLNKNPRESLVPGSWSPGSRPNVRYGDAVRNFLNLDNF